MSEMETKRVQRDGRKVTAWRMSEVGAMACGHVSRVTTEWHWEGDGTRGAAPELVARFAGDCPDCRVRALGGGAFLATLGR